MKGTNPETQGHRWAKRVKKRLKKEQKEDGQWEDLERKRAREAEEAAAAAAGEASESASASEDHLDGATDLRDEEGLDPAELAAVRAVKAAAAAAAERLARLQKDEEGDQRPPEGASKSDFDARPKKTNRETGARNSNLASPVSSNPFAALGRLQKRRSVETGGGGACAPLRARRAGHGDVPGSIPGADARIKIKTNARRAGESAVDARNRLAAEGAAAAVSRKRVLGISGVAGSSAKKLKKRLKRARQAAGAPQ
jgi:hypothetical protein